MTLNRVGERSKKGMVVHREYRSGCMEGLQSCPAFWQLRPLLQRQAFVSDSSRGPTTVGDTSLAMLASYGQCRVEPVETGQCSQSSWIKQTLAPRTETRPAFEACGRLTKTWRKEIPRIYSSVARSHTRSLLGKRVTEGEAEFGINCKGRRMALPRPCSATSAASVSSLPRFFGATAAVGAPDRNRRMGGGQFCDRRVKPLFSADSTAAEAENRMNLFSPTGELLQLIAIVIVSTLFIVRTPTLLLQLPSRMQAAELCKTACRMARTSTSAQGSLCNLAFVPPACRIQCSILSFAEFPLEALSCSRLSSRRQASSP